MKKTLFIVMVSLSLMFSSSLTTFAATPTLTNSNNTDVETASVAGKSHVYYISKSNVKDLYHGMKKAQSVGGWSSIVVGIIPGGQAAAIGIALSSSAVGKKEVEKAYHKNMRLKVTYTYGVTMSLNTTTFKAVN